MNADFNWSMSILMYWYFHQMIWIVPSLRLGELLMSPRRQFSSFLPACLYFTFFACIFTLSLYICMNFLSYYVTLTKPGSSPSLHPTALKELLSCLMTMINTTACPSGANSDLWQKYISIVKDVPFMFHNNNLPSSHAYIPTLFKCCHPSSSLHPLTSDSIHIVSTKCPPKPFPAAAIWLQLAHWWGASCHSNRRQLLWWLMGAMRGYEENNGFYQGCGCCDGLCRRCNWAKNRIRLSVSLHHPFLQHFLLRWSSSLHTCDHCSSLVLPFKRELAHRKCPVCIQATAFFLDLNFQM